MPSKVHLVTLGGSRAFGTAFPDCDYDYYGVFTRSLRDILSILPGTSRDSYQWQHGDCDYNFHELAKYLRLALKGNPTVLDTVYSPHVIYQDGIGQWLRDHRHGLLSKRVLRSYVGYAGNQLDRYDRGVRLHSKTGKATAKYLSHAIRLLWDGLHLAKYGEFVVELPSDVIEQIQLIRTRQPESVVAQLQEMLANLKEAIPTAQVRDEPGEPFYNEFLYCVRTGGDYGTWYQSKDL